MRPQLVVGFAEERYGLEPIVTVNAFPEIGRPARSVVFKPNWRGDQTATLRTRILVRQIIRYGSDHDASPICFAVCKLQRAQLAESSTLHFARVGDNAPVLGLDF
jgi:hypothetical protein